MLAAGHLSLARILEAASHVILVVNLDVSTKTLSVHVKDVNSGHLDFCEHLSAINVLHSMTI